MPTTSLAVAASRKKRTPWIVMVFMGLYPTILIRMSFMISLNLTMTFLFHSPNIRLILPHLLPTPE